MHSLTQLTILNTVLTLVVVILAGAYVNHSQLPIVLEETPSFPHVSETTSAEESRPTSVTLDTIRPFEEVDGYTYVEATLHGTVERKDGSEGVYAGHLIGKMGLMCAKIHNEPPNYADREPCTDLPVEDGSKIIAVQAQTDVKDYGAAYSRFPNNPKWRQYELADVSHLPAPIVPGIDENQNPANPQPVFRAAFHNLTRWITEGDPAPPSRFLEGTLNEDGTFDTDLDEDGNALGGLRLPHMEQVVDGVVAGAPLGIYTGTHPEADKELERGRWIGGYFGPFSSEELAVRYPDHETYVQRVNRAADYLLEAGYILEEDRDAYVQEAERNNIGAR